jgi:hypothetical protein
MGKQKHSVIEEDPVILANELEHRTAERISTALEMLLKERPEHRDFKGALQTVVLILTVKQPHMMSRIMGDDIRDSYRRVVEMLAELGEYFNVDGELTMLEGPSGFGPQLRLAIST